MKKVSVVMCTYNGAKYLREQLDSVLNQSYPIYELIVQDDKSSDDTVPIIREYMTRYDNIHLYINDVNIGPHPNFSIALQRANGDYVCSCDQDDIWFDTKIEQMVKSIGEGNVVVSTDIVLAEDKTTSICDLSPFFDNIYIFRAMPGHATMIRHSLINNIYYGVQQGLPFDFMIGILGLMDNKVVCISEPSQIFRRHANTVTGSLTDKPFKRPIFEKLAIRNKWFRTIACMVWIKNGYIAEGVTNRFAALKNTIPFIKRDYAVDDDFCKLIDWLSTPTLFNVLRAAQFYLSHSEDIFGRSTTFRQYLARKSMAFRYVFDFIWTVRNEEHL